MPKVYDTQDAVPQDERDDYVEHEGKWHPKIAIDLEAERQKRAKLLDEKKQEEQKRKDLEKRLEDLERSAKAKEKGVSEEELQRIRDEEAAARKPIQDELEKIRTENRQLKLTDRVQALFLANGGMKDRLEDAMMHLEKRTDLGDEGGIVFKDKAGKVTADGVEAFFKKFKQEKSWLFEGSGVRMADPAERTTTQQRIVEEKRTQVQGAF